jgi:shikimate dehydrogenase
VTDQRNPLPRSILVGLLGQGVKPSLTPEMHEREAARHGLRYVYKTVDLDDDQVGPDHLRELLGFAVELGYDGLNVTHPIKQAMVPLVDQTTSAVKAIGALNTVLIRDGATAGHNTDVTGFGSAFRDGLPGVELGAVVLLGAGGAGTAVAHALVELGVDSLLVIDPDSRRTKQLCASVDGLGADTQVAPVDPADLEEAVTDASGLVNATPVGMAAHPGTPVPADLLRPDLWVADIVYRPLRTELLRAAEERGCLVLSGAGMAVHQAADSFELFVGRHANRGAIFHDFEELVADEVHGGGGPAIHARGTPRERKHER